jgi:hypothetical protein
MALNLSQLQKLHKAVLTQEMKRLLGKEKVHYSVQKSPPPVTIFGEINPTHTAQSSFPNPF